MTIRENIVANAFWGADNEPEIHYSQGGHRYDALSTPYALPLYTDCSGFATLCYAWAGAPDPNGLDYNGSGYTGTLLGHLPEISMEQAQIGDLIVYGPGTGDHVVIIVATGEDPVVVSHGQERGPVRTRHSIEKSGHKSPVRVLQGLSEIVEQPQSVPEIPKPQETYDMCYLTHANAKYIVIGGHIIPITHDLVVPAGAPPIPYYECKDDRDWKFWTDKLGMPV